MFFQKSPDSAWEVISEALDNFGAGPIANRQAVGGGSINSAFRVETKDGQRFFIKLNREELLDMFEAEFEGLIELRKPDTIRVPRPIGCGAGHGYSWLITEYIELHSRNSDTSSHFGQQFAELHRFSNDRFGWHRDNTIGSTPQINDWADSWIDFYRQHRLGFQLQLAAKNGYNGSLQQKGERLQSDLGKFFESYSPQPSLMHGDLWGGNKSTDAEGNPVIFDPAVYYGDREADLAMTELFGGFPGGFYEAYDEVWPLDEGYGVRKTLYNLYHILNHANLFGGGYAMQAESMMDHLLAEV